MARNLKLFIVNDDPISIDTLSQRVGPMASSLDHGGFSDHTFSEIIALRPDCVMVDMIASPAHGLEAIRKLRQNGELDATKLVAMIDVPSEPHRSQAFSSGADGVICQPTLSRSLKDQILNIVEDRIELRFWGIRGTLPVPGPQSLRYGGNTSCVSLEFPGGEFFIFDAGSGIKVLSDYLLAERPDLVSARLFISHPHWDHINALPFFAPLYLAGRALQICGPAHGNITMRELISGQMDGVYFPIKIQEFSANVDFRDLKEEDITIGGIGIRTMLLNHPGYCLGYRVSYNGRVLCYMTDNEIYPPQSEHYTPGHLERFENFVKDADVLIADSTYTADVYASKINWGHSAVEQVAALAGKAGVKTLFLFHHDPSQSDNDIDRKLELATAVLRKNRWETQCLLPVEKQAIHL